MAVTRNVHRIDASIRNSSEWGTGTWQGKEWVPRDRGKLHKFLNERLESNERIVGTHYEDGTWVIITETYGLGPKGAST